MSDNYGQGGYFGSQNPQDRRASFELYRHHTDLQAAAAALEARVADLEAAAVTPGAWTAMALDDGWVNYGGIYATAAYRKVGDMVQLRGLIKSGLGSNTTPFVLPVGHRPPATLIFPADASSSAHGRINVLSSGAVTIQWVSPAVGTGYFSLSGVQFSVTA